MKKLNLIFVTFFGLGYFYKIPGTVTSLLITSLLFFFFEILKYENLNLICISFILIFFYSFYAVKVTEKKFTNKDPKEIVIDEALGQSLPIIYILYLNLNNELNIKIEIYYALSFFFFRFFDIFKPFPVNYFDQNFKNFFGIIMDDIIAGLYSIILIYLINLNFYEFKITS